MKLPVTRYYGSKRRVVDKIWHALRNAHIKFNSFLDLFGGTGIVSYYMLAKGKQVCYNDLFAFNCENAKALLASPKNTLSESEALELLKRVPGVDYDNVIERNYHGIYYLDQENRLIDTIVQNIGRTCKNLCFRLQPFAIKNLCSTFVFPKSYSNVRESISKAIKLYTPFGVQRIF